MVRFNVRTSREVTTKLLGLATDGIIDWERLAEACLNYMSEDDVARMAESEQFDELWSEE
jgi:hypothetical protein